MNTSYAIGHLELTIEAGGRVVVHFAPLTCFVRPRTTESTTNESPRPVSEATQIQLRIREQALLETEIQQRAAAKRSAAEK